ncbi:hypothetical protein [Candidatus Poriferisodalis sp.]|uniref:hypothetical protein n=1 Tax=Candidatus Poriferisodalis sp. TaxID=3101277 RepID=UPI003B02D76A
MPLRARRRRNKRNVARLDKDGIADLYADDPLARLVVVVASDEAALDSGSVAVAIARNWAMHGRDVLLVDADASGSALARRLEQANRANFSPATRGLPSLMAARRPLTARLLSEHCWRLNVSGKGTVSLLLGPTSDSGASLSAVWLADGAVSLLGATADRTMVMSMSDPLARGQEAFLRAASAVVLVAPADTDERFEMLCALGGTLTAAAERCTPCLVIDGPADRGYEEIRTASGVHVAGQLEAVPERVLLRNRRRRRDGKTARLVEELAARIAFLAREGTCEGQGRAA